MGRVSALPDPESEPAVASADDGAEPVEPVADLGYRRWDCTSDDPELRARAEDDARAAIEAGECIVLPTDTVYGIGADAFNGDAVQGLLDAKVRGRDMPPPVLIGEPSLIRALATDIPDAARDLVSKHWPGPLTIILKRQPSLKMDLGDAEGTVALRVPDHELARDILRATGPMAVSSANISGLPAALTCDEAIDQLGASVSVYLDGGRLGENGQPASTIVDFTQADHGQVLRRGALSMAVLRETLPDVEDLVEDDEDPVADEDPGPDEDPVTDEGPDEDQGTDDDPVDDGRPVDEPGATADGAEDVVDAEVVQEPGTATGEESSADIRSQIENASTESDPSPAAWHEPTTDELRITHPDHAFDQPDLFESEQTPGDAPAAADPRP
jgi:tRNA threonylcarbamoyl adenosine modification protein (Sua5/YciO/YrdC/YwlC family)